MAAARTDVPAWVAPMLASPGKGAPRTGAGWAYEYKLDGYRACLRVAQDGTTVLTSRNGLDFSAEFAELTGVLGPALEGRAAVLDGEIVVYDEQGRIEFGALQQRRGRYQAHLASARREEPFADVPVRFLAFDLLQLGGRSLLAAPYAERRAELTRIPMPDPYRIAVLPSVTFEELAADRLTPQQLLRRAAEDGAEGLVVKRRNAAYLPGRRTEAWLKHPLVRTQEVLLCGWKPGQRGFTGTLGSLLLGAHDPGTGELVYLGDVGTGFSQAERDALLTRLRTLERRTHPFAHTPPREDTRTARWAEPELVGEVVYRQFTRGAGRLRHTAWRGLRADRDPAEVIAPLGRAAAAEPQERASTMTGPATKVTVQAGRRQLVLSNLDKPLYPDGFTKGEVIHYYSTLAEVLLPHLADRPVTFIRFPDGVGGQQFFAKNVAKGAPDWLSTVELDSQSSRGGGDSIEYVLLTELAALVWAANSAALELHIPQWRVGPGPKRRPPDRLVFDLDPGAGTSVVDCCRVAERLREVLLADGLTPVAKTSGSKGMQVYCGIRCRKPELPSAYAKAIAERFAAETPELVTAKMAKALRPGRVFIDWSQNNPAKTTIAPYSLRGRDRPTASTPVTWAEVRACRRAEQLSFTAGQVLDRVAELGDLFAEVDQHRAALPAK